MDLTRPATPSKKLSANAQARAGSPEERGVSARAGAADIGANAIAYAEINLHSALDYAPSLLHAKDRCEIMRLQRRTRAIRMRSLTAQASEMEQIVSGRRWRQPSQKFRVEKGIFPKHLFLERRGDAATMARRGDGSVAPLFWRRTQISLRCTILPCYCAHVIGAREGHFHRSDPCRRSRTPAGHEAFTLFFTPR